MKLRLNSLALALLTLASGLTARAGSTNFNFTVDPTTLQNGDGTPTIIFAGARNWTNPAAAGYFWSTTNGQGGAADGFISLVDNTANQSLLAAFPYLDGSNAPIAAFTIDMDLRIGNPTNANSRPADGFSVCFARNSDLVLSNAWPITWGGPGVLNGFAGAASIAQGRSTSPGTTSAENGTKTGIAVAFDAFEGGWLPDANYTNSAGSNDREGIALRVDDTTLTQFPLPDRNGNCTNTTCQATACADINSIQTGPFMGTTNVSRYTNLCWQHLKIVLTNNTISVTWKGRTAISTNYPYWSPTAGRIVLAARTGGNCENVHVDNVAITTYADTNSYVQDIAGTTTGCRFILADFSNQVSSVTQVLIDDNDVTSFTVGTRSAPFSYGTVTLPTNLVSYSKHVLALTWQTDAGTTVSATNLFIVPVYSNIPTNGVFALADMDTSKPGFLVNAVQTRQNNPNGIPWTEQQLIGLRGSNVIGASIGALAKENGLFVWDGALDFQNPTGPGLFPNNYDLANFGISQGATAPAPNGAYDQCAVEFFGYIYFPTSGIYYFVFGSDDSYQLTLSQSPYDRMGTVLASLQGNRLMTAANPVVGTDLNTVYVSQPGCYPFRLLYENGGGAGGIEWYTYDPYNPTTPFILVNDTNTPGALLTYRPSAAPVATPYVKRTVPVRNDPYATFFQPVVVDLADGTDKLAVDTTTLALSIDGQPQQFTLSQAAGVSHIVQILTNFWSTSTHTSLVSFNDLNGTNYTYSWNFSVLGGVAAPTNSAGPTGNMLSLPLAARVDTSTLSQPGFRIHSHQMYFKQANSIGTAEEALEGLHGPNIADLSNTNGPGFFIWNDVLDMRKASGTGTGAAGEYNVDASFAAFGINPLRLTSSGNNVDNSALEVGAWLVFPAAGPYIMHINSDDGILLTVPQGANIFNKAGQVLALHDAGGGMTGESATGLVTGNSTYSVINVPSAGAYPFRLLMENGSGDAGLEWSVYQPLPDGTVSKVPINDPGNPQAVKAYQVSSAPTGPAVTYANPAPLAKDVVFYQPVVIDITDGTGASTDTSLVDKFTIDGVDQLSTATRNGSTTHIVQNLTLPWPPNTTHSNILVFHDSLGSSYSNYWVFTTINFSPFGVVQIPLTNAVPLSSLDLNQPGLRIKPYEVTTNILGNTVAGWEGVFEGLSGPNLADLSNTNGPGFFSYKGPIEFANAITGDANAPSGEWEWDLSFLDFGIQPNATGSTGNTANLINYSALDIGTYLYFPRAGTFIMEVDCDDDFRVSCPYGNPFNKFGVYLSSVEAGHGAANAGFGPRGGTVYFAFSIPAPGAYPFRLMFGNITGGSSLEWNIFEYLADGSVAQVLIGDTNALATVQAYQTSSLETPYVAFLSPVPGNTYGPNQPAITLTGNAVANTITNNGPVQQDVVIGLADAATSVNTNTVHLSLNGYEQPISITVSNGMYLITRAANDPTWWPSGQVGTLLLTFQDNLGRTINMPLTTVATPFWGTLANGLPLGRGDTNRPGFLMRTYALNQQGSTAMATRIHVAEQALAGIWGTNNIGTSTYGMTVSNGYFVARGTGRLAGVPNFTIGQSQAGDFQASTNNDSLFPGIPNLDTTVNNRSNSFVVELLAYVEFPTAGTYTLGVNSDDGFRLTQGFTPPANNGALIVNSPASLSGPKPTAQDTYLASYSLTNFVTGNLVLVQGPYAGAIPGNYFGSTNYNGLGYSVDGCVINNGAQLAGNIALIYRSTSCGFAQQVQNAAAAGAIAVVFVQNRPASEGWFPTEAGVTPMQPIPAVMIDLTNGLNLIAAMATNAVSVTLTPMDYLINPPPAQSPLGQADVGRGVADTLFPVIVPQPGAYPIRLLYYQGGGGAALELFSVTNGQRVLINDQNFPSPLALKSYYGLALPTLSITSDGVNLTVTWTGTLLSTTDPSLPVSSWTAVSGTSPLTIPISSSGSQQYFRAVLSN